MDRGYRTNRQTEMSDECGVPVVFVEKEANESLSAVAVFERLPLAALLSFHNSQH